MSQMLRNYDFEDLLVSHFLTLALVWWTFEIQECAKQRLKSTRRKSKNLQLEKIFPRRIHHEKDLYNSQQSASRHIKSALSRHALGRITLDSNQIYIRLPKSHVGSTLQCNIHDADCETPARAVQLLIVTELHWPPLTFTDHHLTSLTWTSPTVTGLHWPSLNFTDP